MKAVARRRQAAAAGPIAAGRRRRGALRAGRLDRPPRRRGPGADLSAACALSRAVARRWRCFRSPISTRRLKKPDLAIKVYERVPPTSPLSRNAEIQLADDLDQLDRTDEAKKRLEHVIAEHPKDTEAILALGNIQRGRKEFAECADAYGKAIDTIANPDKSNWVMFYFRGICYERSHQWPNAEADMKKALELYPGAAAGAQLSRLFLGRPGRPSRRRHGHDPPRGRAAAGRRLHRRFAGLGLFPHRQLRRGGQESRARRRAQARGPDHQRSSGRRLLAGRPDAGSAFPVVACQGPQPGQGRPAQDRGQDQRRACPTTTSSAADAAKDKAKKAGNGG